MDNEKDRAIALDAACRLLKVDVEGMEVEVLKGAMQRVPLYTPREMNLPVRGLRRARSPQDTWDDPA
jgi:hypothetical protein